MLLTSKYLYSRILWPSRAFYELKKERTQAYLEESTCIGTGLIALTGSAGMGSCWRLATRLISAVTKRL